MKEQSITSKDLVFATLTAHQLKKITNTQESLKNGIFKAGRLNGCGVARLGKYGIYVGNFADGVFSGWGRHIYTDP